MSFGEDAYLVIWEPKEPPPGYGRGGHIGRSHMWISRALNAEDAVRQAVDAFDPEGSFWAVPHDALTRVHVEKTYAFKAGESV